MGYYVTLDISTAQIPADKLDACYKALCALNKRDDLKTGGSWSGGKQTEKWFSWMPTNYPETCEDAKAVFEALGFDCEQDAPNEPLRLVWYDSKTGAEEHFLKAAAAFIESGGYMEWRGEDGSCWRHDFIGGEMVSRFGRIVYE